MSIGSHALYDAAATRRMDAAAGADWGLDGATLMARAGEAAFDALTERWPEVRRILLLAGRGNNAGDGYVVARAAQAAGIEVTLAQLLPSPTEGPAHAHAEALAQTDVIRIDASALPVWLAERAASDAPGAAVVVDAVFGSGLQRAVSAPLDAVFEIINASGLPTLALDIPSGVRADSGAVLGAALRADLTVTFIAPKLGLYTGSGVDYTGDLVLADLGVPERARAGIAARAETFSYSSTSSAFRPRHRGAHKGDFGHVLVIGGGEGMPGAALLAGMAAARTGAGLVTIATWPAHAGALVTACPSLMVQPVASPADLAPLIARAKVLVVGPGLGHSPWAEAMLEAALVVQKPLVLDADGLNLLADAGAQARVGTPTVMTPHPGEAARLLGWDIEMVNADRVAAARAIAERHAAICVLKGAGSIVANASSAAPAGVCTDGNPGMASAGMGDVLSGVLGSMLGQFYAAQSAREPFPTKKITGAEGPCGRPQTVGLSLEQTVRLAVALHAKAGDLAAEDGPRGLLAGDLLPALRTLVNPCVI